MRLTKAHYPEIEQLYKNGNSQGDIAKMLTAQGYRTARGLAISQSNVYAFLTSKGETIVASVCSRNFTSAQTVPVSRTVIRRRAGVTTRLDRDFEALAKSNLSNGMKSRFYKILTNEL